MPHDFRPDSTLPDPLADEPIEQCLADLGDLEVRCRTNVAAVRDSATRPTSASVEVRAANVVDREARFVELATTAFTSQGVGGIAPQPVMVGSVFHLRFPSDDFEVRATLAVCDRCVMLGDASFELHFRFLQTMTRQGERSSAAT